LLGSSAAPVALAGALRDGGIALRDSVGGTQDAAAGAAAAVPRNTSQSIQFVEVGTACRLAGLPAAHGAKQQAPRGGRAATGAPRRRRPETGELTIEGARAASSEQVSGLRASVGYFWLPQPQ